MWIWMVVSALAADDAALAAACKAKDAAACSALARSVVTTDPKGALKSYRKACKLGHAEACVDSGLLFASGVAGVPDIDEARRSFEQACTAGSVRGCAERAASAQEARDDAGAATWATRGCERHEDAACLADEVCRSSVARSCGIVYGIAEGDQQFDRAIEFGTRACRLGDVELCLLAYNTPRLDASKKLAILKLGCEEQQMAPMCNELGMQLVLGDLGEQDEVAGIALVDRACTLGSVEACLSRADSFASNPATAVQAVPFFERACALGSTAACAAVERAQAAGAP
jgi:TPR repeat protein